MTTTWRAMRIFEHESDQPADLVKVANITAATAEWLMARGCVEGAELLYRNAERLIGLPHPMTFDAEPPA